MCRFGRILAKRAIWVEFSRSKWSLKIVYAEFRQDTHGISCANIILNHFTRQTNRHNLFGPAGDKSWSKSTTPPQPGRRVAPGIRPQGITTGRRGSRGCGRKWHRVALCGVLRVVHRLLTSLGTNKRYPAPQRRTTTPAEPSCNSLRADTRGHTPTVVGEGVVDLGMFVGFKPGVCQ